MKIGRFAAYISIISTFTFPFLCSSISKASNLWYLFTSISTESVFNKYLLSDTLINNKNLLEIKDGHKPSNISNKDTIKIDSIISLDRVKVEKDSIHTISSDSLKSKTDSIIIDSAQIAREPIEAIVNYTAKDTLVMVKGNKAYLYGEAEINYTNIKLTSEVISIDIDSAMVDAKFGIDSIGNEFGYPVFFDDGVGYESKFMKYNFKTKMGFSKHLVTEQGEGIVIADIARKNEDDSFFIQDGKYTVCDHDEPHFYLAMTKGKVIPGKDIVIGPSYLVVEGLKIPFIGLPFGFFPFKDKYSSGIIMPSYGDELERGFNLHDGGYYFAINDYVDLKLLGTIYTKGSWGLNGQSTYRKRYKYSGNVNIGYQFTKYEDKGMPDYSAAKDFRVAWSHSQDPKANLYRTFSASVNFTTQSYSRNNLNEQFTQQSTSNNKSSSISFSQRFPNSPWSATGALNVNQTSSTGAVDITSPDLTVGMTRVFPFKNKERVGNEKWFEKIQFSYTGNLKNRITTTEDHPSLGIRNWNYAIKHNIPVSATFSLFNYLNITPSVQYTERWYTKAHDYSFENGRFVTLDSYQTKFKRVYDFNTSLSLQTKLYGFFTPLLYKKAKIRHVFTPSVSFSYAPNFSDPMWGFYENIYGFNPSTGEVEEYKYFPYQSQSKIFGSPNSQGTGSVSFNFQNNVEMRIPSASDSTGYKKISLIDNLGINFNYNSQAKEYKWSDIGTSLRLKFSKNLSFNLNATFDPYMYGFLYPQQNNLPIEQRTFGRLNKLRIDNGKSIARLKNTSYSINPSFNQDTFPNLFNKLFGRNKENGETSGAENGDYVAETDTDNYGNSDQLGYVKNKVTWNFGFSLTMGYQYSNEIDYSKMQYYSKFNLTNAIGFNGAIKPTANWNATFYGNYNFDQKTLTNLSISINRNLHCWTLSASFQPVGPYKTYYVSLRANSSMLQDLKKDFRGRSTSYDPKWD